MGTVATQTIRASSALTASASTSAVSTAVLNHPAGSPTGNTGNQNKGYFQLDCTTSSGTNPRLFVDVMGYTDAGDTFLLLGRFAGVTSTSIQRIPFNDVLPPNLFASATVNGTGSPSFTFSVKAVFID